MESHVLLMDAYSLTFKMKNEGSQNEDVGESQAAEISRGSNSSDLPHLKGDELLKELEASCIPVQYPEQCSYDTLLSNEFQTDIQRIAREVSVDARCLNMTEVSSDEHEKKQVNVIIKSVSKGREEICCITEEGSGVEADAPVFDRIDSYETKSSERSSLHLSGRDSEQQFAWPETALAFKNFVKDRGADAVSNIFQRLSRKNVGGGDLTDGKVKDHNLESGFQNGCDLKGQKTGEKSWNLLRYIKIMKDLNIQSKTEGTEAIYRYDSEGQKMRGRAILYTRLGSQECREIRSLLHARGIKYVEINVDIYPSRKLELEKNTGSTTVPKLYFNDVLIGGISELKEMEESGKLAEKINNMSNEEPSTGAPVPPLCGEDDPTSAGIIDDLAITVKKMRESILVKDRFYKMRRYGSCFLGSEAVDFLVKDQHLEREEAVEFGRRLARQHLFQHVLEENMFEDGNHVYQFLDNNQAVGQCHNISRGIIYTVSKPITELASWLRFLMSGILEAYVSGDGRHVDYKSIHGSEEFARSLRIVEELQRVDVQDLSREEKLAFFINLYNIMVIHATLIVGHPVGPLDRRKLFDDFKYVIGGAAFSLSAIQNGILRGNQRPPYALFRPFGANDKRAQVALPYPEPLVHFALVAGNRSAPALRCYSPTNIDKELMEAACDFIKHGGVTIVAEAKTVHISKIFKWYSVDFGKNELDLLKFAANFLEPPKSEELLQLLGGGQLKVLCQPYSWEMNF